MDSSRHPQFAALAQQIISRQLDISDIIEKDSNAVQQPADTTWNAICSIELGGDFDLAERAHYERVGRLEDQLTDDQRVELNAMADDANRLHAVELRAAFALGKHCGYAEASEPPAPRVSEIVPFARHINNPPDDGDVANRAARVTAKVNALLNDMLTLPQFRESDDFPQLVGEYLSESPATKNVTYKQASRDAALLHDRIEQALPDEHRALLGKFCDLTWGMAWAESMAAFDVGRRAEAAIANHAPASLEATVSQLHTLTPLEIFIDALQVSHLPLLTEAGTDAIRQQVQIALPFLPAILVSGGWYDWTDGDVAKALDAVRARFPGEDADDREALTLEAHYLTGIVVGFGLAQGLHGTKGGCAISPACKAERLAEMQAASTIEAANMVASMLPYLQKLENKDRC